MSEDIILIMSYDSTWVTKADEKLATLPDNGRMESSLFLGMWAKKAIGDDSYLDASRLNGVISGNCCILTLRFVNVQLLERALLSLFSNGDNEDCRVWMHEEQLDWSNDLRRKQWTCVFWFARIPEGFSALDLLRLFYPEDVSLDFEEEYGYDSVIGITLDWWIQYFACESFFELWYHRHLAFLAKIRSRTLSELVECVSLAVRKKRVKRHPLLEVSGN